MKRKHYLAWRLTAALTAASVMPMTVYAQPASAGGGKVKVVEGDVSGEMQGGVMSPGAVAVEGADLTVPNLSYQQSSFRLVTSLQKK